MLVRNFTIYFFSANPDRDYPGKSKCRKLIFYKKFKVVIKKELNIGLIIQNIENRYFKFSILLAIAYAENLYVLLSIFVIINFNNHSGDLDRINYSQTLAIHRQY